MMGHPIMDYIRVHLSSYFVKEVQNQRVHTAHASNKADGLTIVTIINAVYLFWFPNGTGSIGITLSGHGAV